MHGQRGEDPTEPPSRKPYAYPPISHEPRIQQLFDGLKRRGSIPFTSRSACCSTSRMVKPRHIPPASAVLPSDGHLLTNGKAGATGRSSVDRTPGHPNDPADRGLRREARDGPWGRSITGVEVRPGRPTDDLCRDIVVVACGALSSALLMLRSTNDAHPNGLANFSGEVGRNYMRHNNTALMAVSRTLIQRASRRRSGLNDFYFGFNDWDYPSGPYSDARETGGVQFHADGLPPFLQWFPEKPFDCDCPGTQSTSGLPPRICRYRKNRIYYKDVKGLILDLSGGNQHRGTCPASERSCCSSAGKLDIHPHLLERTLYLGKNIPDRWYGPSGGDAALWDRPRDLCAGHLPAKRMISTISTSRMRASFLPLVR